MNKAILTLLSFALLFALPAPAQDIAFPTDSPSDSVSASARQAAALASRDRLQEYLSKDYPAEVECVRVSGDKVRVRGVRPGGRCFLVEITPWEDIDPAALSGQPVRLWLRHFRRSFPRTVERDGITYDRSLSRWAVVRQTEGGMELFSHARYADDVAPVRSAPKMELTGKKGLGGFGVRRFRTDLDSLGIRSVTINIHLNSLLYGSERPGTIAREYGGRTFWFDSTSVDYLDSVFTYCTKRGVITSAITLVDLRSADPDLTPVFRHPDCNGGFYSMPNMTTPEGFNAYAAVLDFLADRCSSGENGRLNNWISHNEVDYGIGWTNMGEMPYELYMDAYEKSMFQFRRIDFS